MREIFYIRLPAESAPSDPGAREPRPDDVSAPATAAALVEFGRVAGDGPQTLDVERADLETALERVGGRRVVVFVPGADVRLAAVTVPARQASKVLAAAPYQLEEQLADDVDTLHFALGPRRADGSHPVAVVARERIAQWLAPFRSRGIAVAALYPDMLALPWEDPDRGSALCEAHQITVRSAAYGGFCCAPEDLGDYLQLADPERARSLRLLVLADAGIDYSRFDYPLELRPGYGSALEALVRHLDPAQSINLLQGAYAPGQDLERHWRPWLAAAGLAAACLLVGGIAYVVGTLRLSHEIAALDAANLDRFHQLFPGETRVVNIDVQLDQQLRALKSGAGERGVFVLLEILAQAVGANQGLRVQNVQYRDGALFLALRATDLQVVEHLREWFSSQRAAALEVQSADAGADGVQVRVKLSPG